MRPRRIGIGQVPVFHSPMDAVAIRASNNAHAVSVPHHHAAASPLHVAAHAIASVLADDAAMEHLERPDLHLASAVHELDAKRLQIKQLVEREAGNARKLWGLLRQIPLDAVFVVAHGVGNHRTLVLLT